MLPTEADVDNLDTKKQQSVQIRHTMLVVLQREKRPMRPDEVAEKINTSVELLYSIGVQKIDTAMISRTANLFSRYFEADRSHESRKVLLIQPHRHLRTW
jgi:hypothetical protein